MAHHLPEHRLPALAVELRAHAEGRQRSWPRARTLSVASPQDVDQVPAPKHSPVRRIADSAFCTATVASKVSGGAWRRDRSCRRAPRPRRNRPAASGGGRPAPRPAQKRVQPAWSAACARAGQGPRRSGCGAADVVGAVERQRLGRRAVAARAADLLIIGLDRFRQIGMRDPADIGLVDAHAEGDRGHHDQPVLGGKRSSTWRRSSASMPAVIGAGAVTRPRAAPWPASRSWRGCRNRRCRTGRARGGKVEDLLARLVLGLEGEVRLGRSKPRRKTSGASPSKQRVTISSRVSASAVAVKAASGTPSARRSVADAQVIGAEIMAPLADAMRLVHGDQADPGAQHALRARGGQPLGRDVEQLQPPSSSASPDGIGFLGRVAGGQRAGLHARLAQPRTWSRISAISGEITTVTPVAHQRRQAGSTATCRRPWA
jgi:hypothetical protein